MKIKPLGERIVIKVLESEEKTKSGIVLPTPPKKNHKWVRSWRSAQDPENGQKVPMEAVGDKVLFAKYAGPKSNWTAKNTWC